MVVNKPAGLFTQAAPGVDNLQTRLAEQIRQRDQHAGVPFIGLPHRLDRGTSGTLLIARNQRALKRFGDQFHSRKIGKYYLVAVSGCPDKAEDQWVDYLRKIPDKARSEICDQAADGARQADLKMKLLGTSSGVSLLSVQLITGRMHQIRVQAAVRGLLVLGDMEYGASEFGENSAPFRNEKSMALHAFRLEIRHPSNAKPMAFTARPPVSWQVMTEELQEVIKKICDESEQQANSAW